ncbi:MAG: carboxypeptidase-like regulatory domain-containing protein, partial [Nitrospiraceae bacterium]|nr:carboxypeptidase-like regulatory domain-containing protein [Nitrospiraceae bacterium]
MHRRTIRARFFTLVSVLLFGIAVLSMLSGCGSNRKYTITGRITSGGTAFNNVRVTLTPDGSSQVVATTVTDADGNYSFQDVTGGTYQLTPSPTNNTFFSPPFRKVYLDGLDALG